MDAGEQWRSAAEGGDAFLLGPGAAPARRGRRSCSRAARRRRGRSALATTVSSKKERY